MSSSDAAALHGSRVLPFLHLLHLSGSTEISRSEQEAGTKPANVREITGLLVLVHLVWTAGDPGLGKALRA